MIVTGLDQFEYVVQFYHRPLDIVPKRPTFETTCLIEGPRGWSAQGVARLDSRDCYDGKKGEELALKRALINFGIEEGRAWVPFFEGFHRRWARRPTELQRLRTVVRRYLDNLASREDLRKALP